MSDDAPKISYEERHDPGFLERLLLDRKPGVLNAVFFLCAVTAIALAVFHLYVAAFGTPEGRSFRSVHLTAMLVLAIFMNPLFRASSWQPISVPGDPRNGLRWLGFSIDLALVALVLFVEVWTLYDIDAFHMRYGEKELPDIIVGGMFIVLVLEATRRAVGWAMVIITGFFISHALYANYFFGFFYGPPVWYLRHTAARLCHLYCLVHHLRRVVDPLRRGEVLHRSGRLAHWPPDRRAGEGVRGGERFHGYGIWLGRRQRRYHGFVHDSAHAQHRLPPEVRRGGRGLRVVRRPDHAADHGRRGVHHG